MLLQPGVEVFEGGEGDVGDFEAAPVHVDGRGVAVDVGGAEGVDVLAVLAVSVEGFNAGVFGKEGGKRARGLRRDGNLRYAIIG